MKKIKLKNAAVVLESVVIVMLGNLESLEERGFVGSLMLYDLLRIAENPDYNSSYKNDLKQLRLLSNDGLMHEDVKNIVLSSLSYNEENYIISVVDPVDNSSMLGDLKESEA